MPTSKEDNKTNQTTAETNAPTKDGSRVRRRIITALCLVVAVAVVDILISLALEPYGAHTELVWNEYRAADNMDTVLVGTSTTAYGFKPQSLDETLGSSSFNMGTPGQSFDNTLATLETAFRDHKIKRVVMSVGFETIIEVPYINSSIIFTQSKIQGEPPQEALQDVSRLFFYDYYFGKQYSITALFPWTYDHVNPTPQDVAQNVRNRLECDVFEAGQRYAQTNDPNWHYVGKGYGGYKESTIAAGTHGTPVTHHPDTNILPSDVTLTALERVFAFCKDRGIPLYVFGAPYTPSAVLAYGSRYTSGMELVRQMAERNGAHYFDLNMVDRSLYNPSIDCFWDHEHLTETGAELTSRLVGQLVRRLEDGEDIRGLFYSYDEAGWAKYCESIDFVDWVEYAEKHDDSGVDITAIASTGSKTAVEYRLLIQDPDTQQWVAQGDYGPSPDFRIEPEGRSSVNVRVCARAVGSDQERWSEGPITF